MGYGIPNFCAANTLLGINEPAVTQLPNGFKVMPNPFYNSIQVNFLSANNALATVQVFDLMGRVLSQENVQLAQGAYMQLPVSSLLSQAAGVYVVSVNDGTQSFFTRIVKY